MNRLFSLLPIVAISCAILCPSAARSAETYDLVIYGGTSAAITAAVQAKDMGLSVIIVSPDKHLGGLTSGGLGWTDSGKKEAVGGLSKEFYHRVYLHYKKDSSWRQQKVTEYGNKGQGTRAMDDASQTMWVFEPHVAERIYDDWVKEREIPVVRDEWLDRDGGVTMKDGRITSFKTLSGKEYHGRMFMDVTYEGDLMATAGVSYHVGREASATYGEEWNGVQTGVLHHAHYFKVPVDPYKVPGDPSSGLLPRISAEHPGEKGAADHRIQAYCFRMCLTNAEENRIPFPKPEGYDPSQYELMLRVFDTGWRDHFNKFDPLPNKKTDTNNHGPFSTDNIGYNYEYPDASYEKRREIIAEHELYQMGYMYFLANDPRVPAEVREAMSQWGLPKDEFQDNGGWSHQLYIREARRMVGHYVMTENELLKRKPTPESIGMGSYSMDSHNVQRYVTPEGYVQNEGDIGVSTRGPYQIAFGSVVPKKAECENLLVPVCVSSSHIAFGSIRMEPVFMILGQSATTAAAMALEKGIAVQDVPYAELEKRLLADGQVLVWDEPLPPDHSKKLEGIVVDNEEATKEGTWKMAATIGPWYKRGYEHDNNDKAMKGKMSAVFEAQLPESGEYEVRFAYAASNNRATNVPVTVRHAGGEETVIVNERVKAPFDEITVSLGRFQFEKDSPATVTVSNEGTDGYVLIDAVQWLKK